MLQTRFYTHLVSPDWARASDGLCAASWAHYEKPCLAAQNFRNALDPLNMVSHNGLMGLHRARPTLAPSRGTPGACGNRSGALHLLYFWNMYFYVLEISFIEILAAFEFSPNSVEFSNSTFKFWPNSTGSQILPSNSGRILQSFKFCLPNSGWNWEPRSPPFGHRNFLFLEC